jgi:hypothetical protein
MGACATSTTHDDVIVDGGMEEPTIQTSSSSSSGGASLSSSGAGGSSGSGLQGSAGGDDDAGSVADGYYFTETGAPTNPCLVLNPTCGGTTGTPCTDLPTTKVIDTTNGATTPTNAPDQFTGTAATTGGPCILEPQDGTLFPNNWLRPRIRFTPGAGQTLFEIRIHADNQANDLYVYTTNTTWPLYYDTWGKLALTTVDQDITVTVTGLAGATASSSTSTFRIAPATAGGTMIYWAAAGECAGQAWLEGFNVGDETVASVLKPSQAQWYTPRDGWGNIVADGGGVVDCIGCHSGVPDGDGGVGHSVAFLNSWDTTNLGWPGIMASVDPDAGIGTVPSWVTPGGKQAFNQPWLGLAAFSAEDWQTEHVAISSYAQQLDLTKCSDVNNNYQASGCPYSAAGTAEPTQPHGSLAWFDLSSTVPYIDAGGGQDIGLGLGADFGTSFGFLDRTGDSNGVEFPAWSHDGKTVAYVSTDGGQDGRLAVGSADIYTVPYNNRQGGTATPLAGAADPQWDEFYPSFASNNLFLAYTRAPPAENMYYNMHDEIFVVPLNGAATATRLVANDPPTCAATPSPGVTNSWPKWSPDVQSCPNGLTYYWIVFSSSRDGVPWGSGTRRYNDSAPATQATTTSQLYLAGMTVDQSSGAIKTYPAIRIWNQPSATTASLPSCTSGSTLSPGLPQSNHTPLWQNITIEAPPPPAPETRPPAPK